MDVLIVGAGPAGLALGWLLARNGARVTVLERETDFARVFRGEGLMPLGLEVLHQMGLRAELDALPGALLESWDIHLDGTEIMHVDEPSAELGDLALRVVSQPALLECIADRASASPGFTLRRGVTVRDLERRDGRVVGVRVTNERGAAEHVEAGLVVGADGRASVVRKRAELALTRLPESYDVLWLKVPMPSSLAGRHPIQIFASGPDVALAYVSWDGRYQIAWVLPKGAWKTVRERDWWPELAALFSDGIEAHLLASRDEVEGPSLLDVIVGRCPQWSAPGVLLLGDAAHPMSPVRAQGINMALRDAVVAANHLVPALASGDASRVDAAARAAQAEREPEVARCQKLQLREVRGQRWARERPWLMAPLFKLAPLLARTGFARWAWLRQQRELRFGVRPVELRV